MTPEAGPTFAQFFDAWELFGTPALAGTIAGALLGALGVYVVVRRMVFLAAALSQAAGLGVAGALWMTSGSEAPSPLVVHGGAAVTTGLAALPFFGRRESRREGRDASMGLTWILGAAGALAIGSRLADAEEVSSLLFGSAVVVLPEQLHALMAVAVVVLVVHLWWMRAFIQVSVDPDGARVRRLPVRAIDLVLLVTLATSISLCTRILGALPVFAFSVLPAVAAVAVVGTIARAFVVAGVLGACAGFAGYLFAFRWSLPVGATQALVAAAFVVVAQSVPRVRALVRGVGGRARV